MFSRVSAFAHGCHKGATKDVKERRKSREASTKQQRSNHVVSEIYNLDLIYYICYLRIKEK